MSELSELSVAEVQELLENHKFHYPAVTYGNDTYPERWDSIVDRDADWDTFRETGESHPEEVEGLGTVFTVHEWGGEGEGDSYGFVLKVLAPSDVALPPIVRYFEMSGYWASYDGGYYDGELKEVKPVVREVTFYE